jgi:oligosaccharyltransferase complex subunit alpha (ribophorin I)
MLDPRNASSFTFTSLIDASPGRLKGQFSRIMHQTQNFYKQTAPHILPSLTLQLPPGIHDTYIYDLIGNVSTSRLRTSPSSSGRNSILEFKPRYPLMGGWNYSFTLGWDAPLGDSVKWDGAKGRYLAQVPVMTIIPGAVIDNAEVKIVLPEGAT